MIEYWREFRVFGEPKYHSESLTLEIHHGGDFMNFGNDQFDYVGGEICWVECLDPDKFSWVELNAFAWRLGYREPPVYYWFKHPTDYVYLPIYDDIDVVKMLGSIPVSRKLKVYYVGGGTRQIKLCEMEELIQNFEDIIPHSEFKPEVKGRPLYAVGYAGVDTLISLEDVQFSEVESDAIVEFEADGDGQNIVEDGFVDSDYEIRLEDDPEFGDVNSIIDDQEFGAHVDDEELEEFDDMGFAGEISDHSNDTEELRSLIQSSDEDSGDGEVTSKKKKKKKVKGRTWVPEKDLKDPHFELALEFANSTQFKDAVRKFALKNSYDLSFQKNTNKKIEVICGKKKGKRKDRLCPFWIYASCISKKSPVVSIKSLHLEHKNCPVVDRIKFCTATLIAKEYSHVFRNDPYISRKGFQDRVRDDYAQNITHRQVIRARRLAEKINEGSEADQYNLLESYAAVLMETNPNSTVKMMTEMEGDVRKFKRFYVCFDACKRGWKEGCRPVIGLDACHIKNNYPGQLLSAVGIDANNGMYPIAYAVAEVETRETWTWFMDILSVDLKIRDGNGVMIMSDKQKGLLDAVAEIVPEAEHRHCVRHLHNNFKKKNSGPVLKNLLWAAARDSTIIWFNRHMKEMANISTKAVDWLNRHDTPNHWSRAHFSTEYKCDILLNNLCESYNAAIVPCRDKSMLVMLEQLRRDLMIRIANRRVAGMKWKVNVGPRIQKIIAKNAKRSRDYYGYRSTDYVFEVEARSGSTLSSKHTIDLAKRTCTCRRWMMSGISCPHAICCIFLRGHEPIDYVNDCYSKNAYLNAYAHAINPVPGTELWPEIHARIQPPPFRRQPGRPKMARRRDKDEEPPAPNVGATEAGTTKMPRSSYVTNSCSCCASVDHNVRTCPTEQALKAMNATEVQVSNQPQPTTNAVKRSHFISSNKGQSNEAPKQAPKHASIPTPKQQVKKPPNPRSLSTSIAGTAKKASSRAVGYSSSQPAQPISRTSVAPTSSSQPTFNISKQQKTTRDKSQKPTTSHCGSDSSHFH